MQIGNTNIPHGLFLAPMAGMTDAAFRKICRDRGAEYSVSEMISALAMCYGDKKTAALAAIPEGDTPTAIQIFGHDPEAMAKAAAMLASGDFAGCSYAHKPAAIDINMGCPVKKIVSSGDGSALMKDSTTAAEIVRQVKRAAEPMGIPVTVKIRAGWDASSVNAAEMAAALASAGADAIYVHARTRDQMYAPPTMPEVIARVRDAVPAHIPVIGNGDVTDAASAIELIRKTGCDGVMIGRGALGNPWVFEEIAAAMDGRPFTPPTEGERAEAALEMIRLMIAEKGEAQAVREARGRAAYFVRDRRGAAAIRARLSRAESYKEYEEIFAPF